MKKHALCLTVFLVAVISVFGGGDTKDLMARMGFSKQEIAATKTKVLPAENESSVEVKNALREPIPDATEGTAPVQKQKNDDQFTDLRRRDWYEDLKQQEDLKSHADFILYALANIRKDEPKRYEECTAAFFKKLAAERQAHRTNYAALSAIAAKIIATKDYDEYRRMKAAEDEILDSIETQRIVDRNDVMELKASAPEIDAAFLEISQRLYQ